MTKLTSEEILKLHVGDTVIVKETGKNAPYRLDFTEYHIPAYDLVMAAIKNGTKLIVKGVVDMDVLSNILYLLEAYPIDGNDPVVFPETGWGLAVQAPEDRTGFVWVFSDNVNDVYVED